MDTRSFGELFCGAGGMAWGLREAGFKPLWAVDADQWACQTYRRMIGDHVIHDRVENVDFSSLHRVEGLAFGFPCNDFSLVGDRKGITGYYGSLYQQAERALHEVQPNWFIAENVPGLLTGGSDIMEVFANAGPGYTVAVHVYDFEKYGVPQKRRRVIGVGVRSDFNLICNPLAPTHKVPVSASQALSGVEEIAANNERTRHTAKVINLLDSIPPGENAWSDQVPLDLRLNVEKVKMSLIYHRLHPDLPAYTVVAAGGGGTHTYHFAEPRALTNRERARIQSFPDEFIFEGPKEQVRKQIGMAVPPLGAQAIGTALRATLEGRPYPSVEPGIALISPNRLCRAI